jgi:hypothetical protein
MIEAMLVVLTNPSSGREDDFNDWYTNIHLRDVLRFRGPIAARRFKRSATQVQDSSRVSAWHYLALYEVSDPALFTNEHYDYSGTKWMRITDAIDVSVLNDFHYLVMETVNQPPPVANLGTRASS